MADPASIRTNNPGAQWMGPVAREFGATDAQSLPGGNNAAIFPDPVAGAAAQFALLSRNYGNMPLSAAISKWSGGNSSAPYTNFLSKQTGIAPDTVLTPDFLASPQGLALVKAQAQWEAGRPYPLTDEQWAQAQARGTGAADTAGSASAAPAAPLSANAVGQAQVVPQPYLAPQKPAGNGAAALEQLGMDLLNPHMPAPAALQLPPAWRPRIQPGSINLATIRPYFAKG